MAEMVKFTVWPKGRQIEIYLEKLDYKDFSDAYRKAHIAAAEYAALSGVETYVTFGSTSTQRCGFPASEYSDPRSTLQSIMRYAGYLSYWDFKTKAWFPLPLDLEEEGYVLVKPKLLPPPKKAY